MTNKELKSAHRMRDLIERFLATSPVKRIQTKAIEDHVIKNLGIQDYWHRGGYLAFADLISQLVQENRLKPIKARKTRFLHIDVMNIGQTVTKNHLYVLRWFFCFPKSAS